MVLPNSLERTPDGFCARWCKSFDSWDIKRKWKEKPQIVSLGQIGDEIKFNSEIDFKFSQSGREINLPNLIQHPVDFNLELWLVISYLSVLADNRDGTNRISCTGARIVINQHPIVVPPKNCPISMVYNPFKFRNKSIFSSDATVRSVFLSLFPCNYQSVNTTK